MQVKVVRLYVGSFFTSLNMQGASVSLLSVDPDRLARLDSPTQACHAIMLVYVHVRRLFAPNAVTSLYPACHRFEVFYKAFWSYCIDLTC